MPSGKSESTIVIVRAAELSARIGVTAQERAAPQRLVIDVEVEIEGWPGGTDLDHSVSYSTLTQTLRQLAAEREWILVEELAEQCISTIFSSFPPATGAQVEVRKFVVPGTEWCGCMLRRNRQR